MFRQNVGTGWTSNDIVRVKPTNVRRVAAKLQPGDMVLRKPRPLRAGLTEGSHDCIGLTPVVITPEMVGSTLAVFTSIEVKTKTGTLRTEQKKWMAFVRGFGGITGVARTPEDATKIIKTGPNLFLKTKK